MRVTAGLAALVLLAAPPASPAVTVHTVSAKPRRGDLSGLAPDGHIVLKHAGKTARIPLADVFRIVVRGHSPVRDPAANVEVRTVDGTCLHGTLRKAKGPLALGAAVLGKAAAVHWDIADLLGLRFTRKQREALDPDRFEQELAKPNKDADILFIDTPKGLVPFKVAVEKIGPSKVLFNWDGQSRSVDTSRIAAVILANSPAERPAQAVVRLADASVLCGGLVALDKKALAINTSGAKVAVPMANVLSVELANPRVVFLSDLRPADVREIPFFNHIWKHRRDRSVGGNPLTLNGVKYARGIGCHTKTVLTYGLGGEYKRFEAVIGIDDEARPRGSVRFVVKADGKQLYARDLTGRDKSVSIALDVTHARTLALVTDFAEDASVGDHADWADARVTK